MEDKFCVPEHQWRKEKRKEKFKNKKRGKKREGFKYRRDKRDSDLQDDDNDLDVREWQNRWRG